MRVSPEIIEAVKTSLKTRARLCYELNVSDQTVSRYWLVKNESNGELTKARVVQIIAEELGVPEDAILVE